MSLVDAAGGGAVDTVDGSGASVVGANTLAGRVRVRISVRHRVWAHVNVVLARAAPNTGVFVFDTSLYGGPNGGSGLINARPYPVLAPFVDSNNYFVVVEAASSRIRGLTLSARSDTFVIRSPNACLLNAACSSNATCTNNQDWGVMCRCRNGYAGADPSVLCVDVNECATDNGGTCVRRWLRYLREADMCVDVWLWAGTGCDPLASCLNTIGGFVCGTCPANHADSPFGCQGTTHS